MPFSRYVVRIHSTKILIFGCVQRHIELGEVIASLRDEGVLVIGSGASWHNNRDLDWQNGPATKKSRVSTFR